MWLKVRNLPQSKTEKKNIFLHIKVCRLQIGFSDLLIAFVSASRVNDLIVNFEMRHENSSICL